MPTLVEMMRSMAVKCIVATGIATGIYCQPLAARNYRFENITDLPTGPGAGRGAEVNDNGDVAFLNDGAVWFYDHADASFLNVSDLTGAPPNPFFLKLNNAGNIAIVETPTSTRDFWFFEKSTQTFTHVSGLPNYPGNSLANFGGTSFDLNDNNNMSFHSGDNNFGDVYVYDHAAADFERITDKPGGRPNGRENEINNLNQVLYMGFPSTYLYDPASGLTTNVNALPGGPGAALTNLDLNDRGDVALMSATVAQYYNATSATFLDLAAAPGWPPDIASSSRSDLSNSGEITFWREGLFAVDTNTRRFSQLNGFLGGAPIGGLETNLNSVGQIALNTSSDIFLATPRPYGDYDNDGNVNRDDLSQLEATFGDNVAIGTAADGDSNRQISGGDFLVWQQNFGAAVAAAQPQAVPEVTSNQLMLVGLLGLACLRPSAPSQLSPGPNAAVDNSTLLCRATP